MAFNPHDPARVWAIVILRLDKDRKGALPLTCDEFVADDRSQKCWKHIVA
jgi:hypothetical protein